jgi:2-polyprenyl-3-methyl-5-hydroxy-6-metoxy-1,4-benzoquinol methylase/glycosyltransferase involved in cell wall biosynthesis
MAIIAKDEEERLPTLLESIGLTKKSKLKDAHVDYVVVCDTGSKDKTRKVAQEYGCHVIDFEWVFDFAAARQASFDAVPEWCDFVTWADCDDIIDGAEKMRQVCASVPDHLGGTMHRYDYAFDEAGNCICELWRERIVRNHRGLVWRLPVHEVLQETGELIRSSDVVWVHQLDLERERDERRNYEILKRAYKKQKDPRTIAYLGTEAMALGEFQEAIELFEEYLANPESSWEEERCQVAHKLSISYRQIDPPNLAEARGAAIRAQLARPDWADPFIDLAEIALREDRPDQALAYLDDAKRRGAPETLLIINPLDYTVQVELMRAAALIKTGQLEEAFKLSSDLVHVLPHRDDVKAQVEILRQKLKIQETEKLFLQLREILVRHDENAKAAALMECAPYFIEQEPAVAQARLDQRERALHRTDPQTYREYSGENPNETAFEAQQIPIPEAHQYIHRLHFLRRGLLDQVEGDEDRLKDLKVLDLSANDGWMAANLSDFGVGRIDCMDLNIDAVTRGRGRRADYPAMGDFICDDLHHAGEHFGNGQYDAVVCFETIEHVPDPQRLFNVMSELANENGRLYVSTPEGAYENGNVPGWATVEHKGHLRAIRPEQLAAWSGEAGVIENMEMEQGVMVSSVRVRPPKGRVVFYAGMATVAPEQILETGLGGSETALAKTAEHFARRGYDVRVYAGEGGGVRGDRVSVGDQTEANGQVLYLPATLWDPGESCDLFISSRVPEAFDRTIVANERALWLHDADYGDRLTPERLERATKVLVMSKFQLELLDEMYGIKDKALLTRNGIETGFFGGAAGPRQQRVVFSSSPDRGLDVLLEVWPLVLKQVPEAELHHTYAPVYHEYRKLYPHLQQFHNRIEELQKATTNVVAHDSLGQQQLAALYETARCWAYPSWNTIAQAPFPEISCISAMEAQAAGVVPVCLNYAALKETVVCGARVDIKQRSGKLTKPWKEEFAGCIIRALTDDAWFEKETAIGIEYASELDWSGVVDQWETALLSPALTLV